MQNVAIRKSSPLAPGRKPTLMCFLAVAFSIFAIVSDIVGCSDSSPSAPSSSASPTPSPVSTCSSGACPMTMSVVRVAEAPNVAVVAVNPPGAFDLWKNGLPQTYPNGVAFVKVGDIVSACRCCGCSPQYVVSKSEEKSATTRPTKLPPIEPYVICLERK